MIHITCDQCSNEFGVEDVVSARGVVWIAFCCPYCRHEYKVGDRVKLVRLSGGINIGGGSSINVKGDIAGRDIIR